jgi:hypothetical protein
VTQDFFLKRTDPLPGESLVSLVHRLTCLNRYEDESWIIRLIEPERTRIQRFDLNVHTSPSQMAALSAKTRSSYLSIYDMTSHPFAPQFLSEQDIERDGEGNAFIRDPRRARYVHVSRVKFCPVCLEQGGYHRIYWDPVYVTACLKHGIVLNDRCSSCGTPVTALEVSRGYHRCGCDLAKEKTIGTAENESQRYIQAVLGIEPAAPAEKDPALLLAPRLFFQLLDATVPALFMRGRPRPDELGPWVHNWRNLPNGQRHVLLSHAFRIFLHWPRNFFDLLSRHRDSGGARGFAGLTGPYRPLGRMFDAIGESDFDFIRTDFQQFAEGDHRVVRKNSRFFDRLAPTRRWVHLTEAARMLGTSRPFAATLCTSNRLPHVCKEGRAYVETKGIVDLLRRWETSLPIEQVAGRLGVSRRDVLELVNAGFLTAEEMTAKTRCMRIEGVTQLEQRFLTGREERVKDGEPLMAIRGAAEFLRLGSRPLTKLLSLVDAGVLDPYRDPSRTGLDGLLFTKSDLDRCHIDPSRPGRAQVKNPEVLWDRAIPKGGNDQIWVSLGRIGRLLGVNPETVRRLHALQLLPIVRARSGVIKEMVNLRAYGEFRQSYVFTDEAAGILKVTRKELYRSIAAGRIGTVINVGRGEHPRFLLRRTEVANFSRANHMSIAQAASVLGVPEELVRSMVIEGKLTRIKSRRRGSDGALLMKTDVEELKGKMSRVIAVDEFAMASGTPTTEIVKRIESGKLLPLSGADISTCRLSVFDLECFMRLISRKEAAELSCVAPETIENWRKKGLLTSESHKDLRGRIGFFYRVKDLERFLNCECQAEGGRS